VAEEKKERDDGTGVVSFDFRMVNQRGAPVIVCLYKLWMRKRADGDGRVE
jgi:hypothetical protein